MSDAVIKAQAALQGAGGGPSPWITHSFTQHPAEGPRPSGGKYPAPGHGKPAVPHMLKERGGGTDFQKNTI